jgi:hypothetical protein
MALVGSAQKGLDDFVFTQRQGLTTFGYATPSPKNPRTNVGGELGDKSADSSTLLSQAGVFDGVDATPEARGDGRKAPNGASGYGQDWFGRIHILPRDGIDYGNIVSAVEETFEIYNADSVPRTLANIVNNASPGVILPDFSAPIVVAAHRSILRNFQTLTLTRATAEQDGLPVFDTTIDFDFTGINDVSLAVSGQRIVFIPFEYEQPFVERLDFLTDVLESIDGREYRISLRDDPRQSFNVRYRLDETQRQRMQILLFDVQSRPFAVPMWHDQIRLTAAASAGATTLSVRGADDIGLRPGYLAAIVQDDNTFDVVTVSSFTDTQLNLQSALINSYSSGARVCPVITAYIDRSTSGSRWPVNLEQFQLTWRSINNSTGALQGDLTPGFWSTYNSRVLLDDCNVVPGDNSTTTFPIRLYKLDNQAGLFRQASAWDRSKRGHQKGFVARSRAEIIQLRKLLLGLRGPQKAFYIPTFIDDITVKDNVDSADDTVDIERIDYTRHGRSREQKNLLRVTLTNGTTLIRTITDTEIVDNDTERLTLDVAWGQNITVAQFQRVEFFELVRFATDSFELTYDRPGELSLFAPVQTVFDDIV